MNPPVAASSPPVEIDLLIRPEWVIPIEPAGVTLTGHALAVDKGRILSLLPDSDARRNYRPRQTIALPGQVLLPGLVNLHTHAAMTLLRGYADDLPLMRWLSERIWPAEARHADAEFVRAGTLLACAEMLRGGITTFNDMYFFPDAAADAVLRSGMRAALGMIAIEFPTRYAADANDYIAKGLAVRDRHSDAARISFCLAPHAPYTVADKTFEKIATLAAQLEVPIHMHVHETAHEIEESLKLHGVRPIERLRRLGLLSPQLIAVHAVHLEPAEIDLLAHHGCHVAHCPTSNMKLASGIPPMAAVHARGVSFGLGTDGAASNNRLDMFHEIRHAALLAKAASLDAEALGAHAVLAAATLGGARALGLESQIGSLLAGKQADFCAVKLDEWLLQPCYDPASHLVYTAGREQVTHVWVGGKLVMSHGNPSQIDDLELLDIAGLWHTRLTS
ncbi:MAG: TRZ/ATZ family hydrolase [Sulfuritalea sp.]|jgi:5-methylthioadenosine/S-adenosylhomocysteine deaminase|nr:TRZ/ATZ family hydrolase [Sulfuritalea sp.]MBK8759048.1 TRZ/ATZ family hydrolase [Sulfuritalea sp.]MBK9351787.1 TRZ/ATZ family hydrolase [Sulfuritalea sp.]MBP6636531.1 TRZ/ATZ family hydrolase [Sulfuritalea sp.]MBP7422477.1 TRZ/ATZ family hydrolase [Sulfuritalea sp.]